MAPGQPGAPGASQQDWPAPGKLNLFLRITGRRADGYHLLQTVFQFVDLHDSLRFTVTRDGIIEPPASLAGHVAPEGELCSRAARALQTHSGCSLGVRIELDKRIPMGGGLGGGSSDAATTLVALNQLWQLDLAEEELAALALRLGADVPVFVHGRAAWAEGVGEVLQAIDLPQPWYLIIVPDCRVDTARVFQAEDLTRDSPPITMSDFLAGAADNDCVPVVRRLYPQLAEVMDGLGRFVPARLTGTGACVFASFPERGQASAVRNRLPKNWRSMICRGRNCSPLLAGPPAQQ